MDFQRMSEKASAGRFERGYLKTEPPILPVGLYSDVKSRRRPVFRGDLKHETDTDLSPLTGHHPSNDPGFMRRADGKTQKTMLSQLFSICILSAAV